MSEDSEDDVNFEEQVKLYNLEKEGKLDALKDTSETKKSYKDKDGVEYEWDEKQKAWFPKISEDFIAMYQASYGVAQSKDGGYTYTDPSSKKIMLWDEAQKQWTYADTGLPVAPKVVDTDQPTPDAVSIDPISGGYVYREPKTGVILYHWNQEQEQWVAPNGITNSGQILPNTNAISKQVSNPEMATVGGIKGRKQQKKKKKEKGSSFLPGPADATLAPPPKKIPKPPEWFEINEEQNTNVYVSNLPEDITLPEFIELMSKYGIIMEDPAKGKLKIKLYQDDAGDNKGDGRCCYLKKESVDLALQLLDGSELRGKRLKVERAKFTLKGDYDPKLKPNKPKSGKKKDAGKAKGQDKLLAWKPDPIPGLRTNREKTIVLKNMFDPKIFDDDASLILEYQKELREECGNFGTVKKVKIYDRNPEGVAVVTFGEFEEADACLEALNGRFYAGRKLEASRWDGKTRFVVEETEEEKEQRLQKWTEFLEKGE